MTIQIRTYTLSDKSAVIAAFQSNCPKYFEWADELDLIYFLDNQADNHFKVVLHNDKIIGCGGHYSKQSEQIFGIAWVFFERFSIGARGFLKVGSTFFNHLLDNIQKENLPYDIVINTTQLMEKTFQKFGFCTEKITANGFGTNLDWYVMRRKSRQVTSQK